MRKRRLVAPAEDEYHWKFEEHTDFVALLKNYAKQKDLQNGIYAHAEIFRRGILQKNCYIGSALINLYAKCGMLKKAAQLLDELPVRDTVSWNALIAGYAEYGQAEDALTCLGQMQSEGHSPDTATFISILGACGKICATDKCKWIHYEIGRLGLLGKDTILGTRLVDIYAKCGALTHAACVFDELPVRNVISWTALIAGYVEQGESKEALKCFKQMQCEGLSPNAVTFIHILKVCGSMGAVHVGKEIHDDIVRKGLLLKHMLLGSALVDMYVKCGAVTKAGQVLEELPIRDVVTWGALIAGYAQHGCGEQALQCYDQMQGEGLNPDAATFVCILKACGSLGALVKVEEIEYQLAKQGLLGKDIMVGTCLIDVYIKCGEVIKAARVLDKLPARDVITWSALIAGYAQLGDGEEALNCFRQMQREGHCPDMVAFISLLKACTAIKAGDKGEEIHNEIMRQGLLGKDIVLSNALLDMYVKCGAYEKAAKVLQELPIRDLVSWSTLIAGYAEQGHVEKVMDLFEGMQSEGLSPDVVTFSSILKACGSIGAIDQGKQIHSDILRHELLGKDIVLGNTLIDMYAKCGALTKAAQVFDDLPFRDAVSWGAFIGACVQEGQVEDIQEYFKWMQYEGLPPDTVTFNHILRACGSVGAIDKGEQVHTEIIRQGLWGEDIALGTMLIDMYTKWGVLTKAAQVFDELPTRDIACWSVLIAGYVLQAESEEALSYFDQMQMEGLSADSVTYICILKACISIGALIKGESIHDDIVGHGLLAKHIVLGNTLVDMYAKCDALSRAAQLLDELPVRNAATWSALISGYVLHGDGEEALICFNRMQQEGFSPDAVTIICILKACGSIGSITKGESIHYEFVRWWWLQKDIRVGNALVDMYAKCGALARAARVLDEVPVRDVASWSALIAGFVQEDQADDALNCFEWMEREGISADPFTFIWLLKACGSIGALGKGKKIHGEIVRRYLLGNDVMLDTSIVDMYAKCGALEQAEQVLDEIPVRNVVTWSAVIAGYAQQGLGEMAVRRLKQMKNEGVLPNTVTLVSLLSACGHSGLLTEGQMQFANMSTKHGITPDLMHHICMVDLYGRAGEFNKALTVIENMPTCDELPAWVAFLVACRECGNVELGRLAFNNAIRIDRSDSAAYVLMRSIYVDADMQEDADMIEALRISCPNSQEVYLYG